MKQIPMLDLQLEYQYMKKDIDAAIQRCLDHQRWILGPEVQELEEKIATYLDVKHCIGCSSGTDALVLSLRALAIKTKGQEYWDRNDLIITTPFTFTATGDAILRAGATPLFVDIDLDAYNIDPQKIREALSSSFSERAVGIIPVHLYGQGCDMDQIMTIAKDHDLFVVEDVAQAFGGTWKGKKLGSIGTTGCFSFFPSKNLGGFGDGGMISTNDDEVAELISMLLKHGGKDKYNVDHVGYNARLDTLQAAVLLAKFKYIDQFNDKRIEIAMIYKEGLRDLDGFILPSTDETLPFAGSKHVYHQYTLRVSSTIRDHFQKYLMKHGISSMIYYPFPLHRMRVFGNYINRTCEGLQNSDIACNTVISLPIEPLQSTSSSNQITKNINEFVDSLTN